MALREYQHYASGSSHGPGRFLLAAAFSLLFAWFGVSAFMRARQAGKTR